jgi:hypothetical protein
MNIFCVFLFMVLKIPLLVLFFVFCLFCFLVVSFFF